MTEVQADHIIRLLTSIDASGNVLVLQVVLIIFAMVLYPLCFK